MPPNPYDQACRYLLRRSGAALLCWLMMIAPSRLRFVSWLETKLTIPGQPERVCDTIAHVQRLDEGGQPWAIPIEFQVKPDPQMLGRVLVYEGMTWILEKPTELPGDRFLLQSVVVNLTGVGQCAQRMLWAPGAETTLAPIERNLSTLDGPTHLEEIAADRAPRALLVWIPLMFRGGEPATIRRWLEIAATEPDTQWRADFALARVFAEQMDDTNAWYTALEGYNVIESRSVNLWKAEGAAKGKVEAIQGILETRFGPMPADAFAKLQQTQALDVLQRWVILAAQSSSLDDFRKTAGI